MFLSREIDIKLCQNDTETYVCKILYKIRNIEQIIFNKYTTNLKTSISQRSLRNSSLLLLLFEFDNFSFLIDIIDNIIYASETWLQNSNQWQCSIIVTWLRLYYVTSILHCHWREFWTYILHVYGLVNLCQFLETGTSDRCLLGIVQLLRFSGFTLYSLSFFLYSPFQSIFKSNRYLFSENSSTTDNQEECRQASNP